MLRVAKAMHDPIADVPIRHAPDTRELAAAQAAMWSTCEDCGISSTDVEKVTCPFNLEINSVETPVVICADCYRARAMDI